MAEEKSDGKPGEKAAPGAGDGDVADAAAVRTAGFVVVGIGASAGGIGALEAMFAALPQDRDPGMAFVIVQHLAPDHRSVLGEVVQRYTRLPVREATQGLRVEPNAVYVIPPGHDMTMADGRLWLAHHAAGRGVRLTVDHFFRSLAAAQRERAICVVLSGAGADGSLGLRDVKGEGGLVIAQAPDTTEYDSMPRAAIATGLVDCVLAPADIPAQLLSYTRRAFESDRPAPFERDGMLKKVCALLRAHTGHDFSKYKETTLARRVDRRMAMHQLDRSEDYLRFAREHPAEVQALFRDLLIGVTNFFRDPDAFEVLGQKVLPAVFARKAPHEPVRVWVCGCSTGEEAYSIAMLLHESAVELRREVKLQVFATDIDSRAIEAARAGVFPASIAADVGEARIARHFEHDAQRGTYRIQKHIRDLLVFSEQDVIKDPPFSKLDLVSCRNLLIYLNADVQKRLIPLFHYALVPGGALFLGTSETVGDSARLFQVVDRKWKLYLRSDQEIAQARPAHAQAVPPLPDVPERHAAPAAGAPAKDAAGLRHVTEQALLSHYEPTAVLVNGRGQILHILGRTGQFLEPADGDASMNIVPMAREGLRRELMIALHKAVAHGQPIAYRGLRVRTNGHHIGANLVVRPVDPAGEQGTYLVVLEEAAEAPQAAAPPAGPAGGDPGRRVAELEQEVRAKDEYLQTTLEEMETANEELRSTNEEMQSVNEELQSTNEELETSKEELQSVNEELSTVNTELQDKVGELSRANNDMNNLLAGTGVGTLFVDHQLRISRFTPAATQAINLIATDVGRPLAHVVANWITYDHLVEDIRTVLDTLVPKEAEVQLKNGNWYLMRIRPYRTIENLIEGAVVTLVDISERKRAEEKLRRNEKRLHVLIHQISAGVSETDPAGRYLFVNDRFCEMLGYTRAELLQRRAADITEPADRPAVQAGLQGLVDGTAQDAQLERRYVHHDGRRVAVHERVSAIRDGALPPTLLTLSFAPP